MSTPKQYYYMKLKEDYLYTKEIKKLRRIAGGAVYVLIYLKLQLLSIKSGGVLKFEGTEPDFAEQLSLETDEEYDNVKVVLNFLMQNNLIEDLGNDDYLLPKASKMIGTETAAAERMRKMREKQKRNNVTPTLQNVTQYKRKEKREKRKDIEIEKKVNVLKHVALTRTEYDSLIRDYGQETADDYINSLNDYIGSKGTKYKSHYHTIRNWYRKDHPKK